MTACWFRLTQPENSSRKKASGGGTGAMAGVCLIGGVRPTGEIGHPAPSRWAEIPEVTASFVGVDGPISGDPHAAGVFAHHRRTFLRNHIGQIVAADFFVVPTATYRLMFVLVLLAHDRRRIRHVAVTAHPTAAWTAQQVREAFPWDEAPRYLIHDRDHLFDRLGATAKVMGIEDAHGAAGALAKCIRRTICGVRSSRVFRSRDRVQRSGRAEADDALLFLLRTIPDSPLAEQGRADSPHDHATRRGRHRGDPRGRGPSSSVRTARGLNARRAAALVAHKRRAATTRHHPAATTTRQPSHRERRDRRDTLDLTSHPHFDTRSGRRARRHQHLPTGITDRRRARRADHGRNELVGWQIGFLVGTPINRPGGCKASCCGPGASSLKQLHVLIWATWRSGDSSPRERCFDLTGSWCCVSTALKFNCPKASIAKISSGRSKGRLTSVYPQREGRLAPTLACRDCVA